MRGEFRKVYKSSCISLCLMTRIAIVGDIEGHLNEMYVRLADLGLDAIFQVGDLGYFPDGTKVDRATRRRGWAGQLPHYLSGEKQIPLLTYFIHGNHEDFDEIEKLVQDPNPVQNLHYLASGNVHDVLGLRVGVIGGVYSSSRYHLPRNHRRLREGRRKNFSHEEVDALLADQASIDMLLTHQGPDIPQLHNVIHSQNLCPVFADILRVKKPSWQFYGHHDVYDDSTFEKTRVVGLQTLKRYERETAGKKQWFSIIDV